MERTSASPQTNSETLDAVPNDTARAEIVRLGRQALDQAAKALERALERQAGRDGAMLDLAVERIKKLA